jgi:hypothetical protein
MQDEVSEVRPEPSVLMRCRQQMDRQTVAYQPAVTLIELLVTGSGIVLEDRGPRCGSRVSCST